MLLIDRYIVRLFLINFVILLFVMFSLVMLIDLVTNLDEFIDTAREMVLCADAAKMYDAPYAELVIDDTAKVALGPLVREAAWLITDWYAPLMVLMYVYLCGLVVVGAMGFTFSDLTRKGELVAMVTGGVSMFRLAGPILVVGCGLISLSLPIQEWIIPMLKTKLARSHGQIGMGGIPHFQVQFARDAAGHLITAANFDPDQQVLRSIHVLKRDAVGIPTRLITAEQGFWNASRGGWELIGAYAQHPVSAEDAPRPATSQDVPEIDFFSTSLSPQILIARQAEIYPSLLSIAQLKRISAADAADAVRMTQVIHRRLSMIVMNMLVLAMGLPFFLRREPSNLLLAVVRSAAVCLGAWGFGLVILQISSGQLNPVASAWLPIVIFLPVSAWLMQCIRT